MNTDKAIKLILKIVFCAICLIPCGLLAYWEYLEYKFEQDPLFYYIPRICNDLDSETAKEVIREYRKKAKHLKDSIGRVPTKKELDSIIKVP